jgi:riboflavin biosynthesis pyrimidine reductase
MHLNQHSLHIPKPSREGLETTSGLKIVKQSDGAELLHNAGSTQFNYLSDTYLMDRIRVFGTSTHKKI